MPPRAAIALLARALQLTSPEVHGSMATRRISLGSSKDDRDSNAVCSISRDVTSRLRTEEALRQDAVASSPAVAAPQRSSAKPSATILYVEDDFALRKMGKEILQEAGYAVLDAGDALEALALAGPNLHRIDLLLTDVVLPKTNGAQLWRQLAVRRPGLPVLYVTGYAGDAMLPRILGAEAHWLEKPFTPADLVNAVDGALRPEAIEVKAEPQTPLAKTCKGLLAGTLVLLASLLSTPASPSEAAVPQVESPQHWQLAGSWTQAEGLPQDRVYAMTQTRDGYIWVGTRGGAARFDGVRFTTFDESATQSIRDNEVWALAEDGAGLWIGTYGGGLARLEGGKTKSYTTRDGLVNDFVRAIARDATGGLWIGTDHGLSHLREGRFTNFRVADGLTDDLVKDICPDREGGVWVATQAANGGGLHRIQDGRVEVVPVPGIGAFGIERLLQQRDGVLWLATLGGLVRWVNGAATRFGVSHGLSSDRIRALHQDGAGRLWIATDRGVDRSVQGTGTGSFQTIVPAVQAGSPSTLLTDREGNLWLGMRARGVARFDRGLFASYTQADGLPGPDVATVMHDRRGTLWVGTDRGLSVLGPGGFRSFGRQSGLNDEPVASVTEDGEGHLWVGTESGLYRTRQSLDCAQCPPSFGRLSGIPVTKYPVIYPDSRGFVWIGSNSDGLLRYDGKGFTRFTRKDGLSDLSIRALVEDPDGSLWVGTKAGGLNRLRGGRFVVYTTQDGLASDSVQALHQDAQGALWIGTRRGLSRFKGGRFTSIGVADGLFANHVYGIIDDDRGNLWMTCGRGVFRVAKQQLDAFADGRIRSIFSTAYGREHGLAATMAAVGHAPVASRGQDGRMFFALSGGLAVANPARLVVNELAPPVVIEELRIDGRVFAPGQRADAPSGSGDMVLRYTALSFVAPQKLRFRYRLEGFDVDWVDAGTRRTAFYTRVPPGRYRFHVIASNSDGVWNQTGANLEIALATVFYRAPWFYAVCTLVVVAAAFGAHRLRMRQLEARERELGRRVEDAISQLRMLKGMLPICASCKRIRDDQGYWSQMESYIREHSEAEFSHGVCPDCIVTLYPRHAHLAVEQIQPANGKAY